MKNIEQLQYLHFLHKIGLGNHSDCIGWAVERLQLNQEEDELDVVLLAAAMEGDEVLPLVENIIRKNADTPLDEQVAAGKYVVFLYRAYKTGDESVTSLDDKFTKLYNALGNPDWLVMLSRNCEYATDIPAFLGPFEEELKYISELWTSSETRKDFEAKYSRDASNQHDLV